MYIIRVHDVSTLTCHCSEIINIELRTELCETNQWLLSWIGESNGIKLEQEVWEARLMNDVYLTNGISSYEKKSYLITQKDGLWAKANWKTKIGMKEKEKLNNNWINHNYLFTNCVSNKDGQR